MGACGGGQAAQQLVAALQAERPQLIGQVIAAGLQQEGQQRKEEGLSCRSDISACTAHQPGLDAGRQARCGSSRP